MKFNLTIELGNEAMSTRGDIATALVRLGNTLVQIDADEPFTHYDGLDFPVKDTNGNTVGRWEVAD